MTFPGGGHSSIFLGARGQVLDEAVTAFLDAELKGDTAALTALSAPLARSGVATMQRAGRANGAELRPAKPTGARAEGAMSRDSRHIEP